MEEKKAKEDQGVRAASEFGRIHDGMTISASEFCWIHDGFYLSGGEVYWVHDGMYIYVCFFSLMHDGMGDDFHRKYVFHFYLFIDVSHYSLLILFTGFSSAARRTCSATTTTMTHRRRSPERAKRYHASEIFSLNPVCHKSAT